MSTYHAGNLRTLVSAPHVPIRHVRRLLYGGELRAEVGQVVAPDTLLGHNGSDELLHFLRVEVDDERLLAKLLRGEGDEVKRGEPVAYYMYMFGLGYREYVSPVNGTIASVSVPNGLIGIREHPEPLMSGLHGRVARVVNGHGVEIETTGTLVEGTAGWGGEAWGDLQLLVDAPDGQADASAIGPGSHGKVLVVGMHANAKLLAAAYRHGVCAVIAGGVDQIGADQFTEFAASLTLEEYQTRYYTSQPADGAGPNGLDRVLMPVIALDGLGPVPIRPQAWSLLQRHQGEHTFVDAGGQAAWAGQRPMLVLGGRADSADVVARLETASTASDAGRGEAVRIIGGRYGGRTGQVLESDVETVLETGFHTTAARVALDQAAGSLAAAGSGEEVVVPWANLEAVGRADR